MATHWGTSWGTNWAHSWDVSVTPPPPTPSTGVPQGGSGSGGRGGGARWERVSSSDGAKPGQLSVKEQNLKEIRELAEIERDLKRQDKIAARGSEEAAEIAAELTAIREQIAEAKAQAEQVTAMAAAFERAGLLLPAEKMAEVELAIGDEEEEILIMLMAIH